MTIHIEILGEERDVEPSDYIDTVNALIMKVTQRVPDATVFKTIMPFKGTFGMRDTTEDNYEYRTKAISGGIRYRLDHAYVGKSNRVIFRMKPHDEEPTVDTVLEVTERDGSKAFGPQWVTLMNAINHAEYAKSLRSANRKARKAQREAELEELKEKAEDPEWSHIGSW